jgi:energy-coupling factor transporter ATP-binding protein EcfA2
MKNFKGLKDLEVNPGESRIIQFTGGSGVGKSSAIEGLMFLLDGRSSEKNKDVKLVNKDAQEMSGEIQIVGRNGDPDTVNYTFKRSMKQGGDRLQTVVINNLTGKEERISPQDFLDGLFNTPFVLPGQPTGKGRGERTKLVFDPLDFVRANATEQSKLLSRMIGTDPEKDRELNNADLEQKKPIAAEIRVLEQEKSRLVVIDGLPEKPIDIDALTQRLSSASAENLKQQGVVKIKNDLGAEASRIAMDKQRNEKFIEEQKEKIAELERNLKLAQSGLRAAEQQQAALDKQHAAAEKAFKAAPEPKFVDVGELGEQISRASSTNSAIRTRERFNQIGAEVKAKQAEIAKIDERIAKRIRDRSEAIKNAKLPVEGLTLETWTSGDEEEGCVYFKGLPLANLSEGEQLKVTIEILMALQPKLRAMFVKRGESLDEKGYEILERLAEKYDFQVWMARLDTSGVEGFVLEEGRVKIDNYAAKPNGAAKKGARKK